jgi:hypothetical protein
MSWWAIEIMQFTCMFAAVMGITIAAAKFLI